ncbi:GH22684 [Drosophila grimshawi]|uniref:GH22684 n=1 Tax=Drosophila grimshawi TaxID=7222 RepID=B4JVF1_DROGR|nr:GH22684 [Drosophila grimshawi]
MHSLKSQLESCLCLLDGGSNLNWLNVFCAEFLEFVNKLQKSINNQLEYDALEIICLCLTQIMICVRHLEYTIQTETASGSRIMASHHHFVDRIRVCLQRLCVALTPSAAAGTQNNATEGISYLKLLDSLLDSLAEFTIYNENRSLDSNTIDSPLEILNLSKQIKLQIDLLLGQTLSFANVALQQDKKALSALCQKVMRDCGAFQGECQLSPASLPRSSNISNQKLRAMTLEHALHQLEDYLNEALLRLVFTCLLDFQRISVDKIRNLLRCTRTEKSVATADDFIADFDVNLDRATQIGIFAIAFAPNLKIKTTVRSCLASFEYLDTSLIPSLHGNASDLHSELLEQHFNEEMSTFKTALHEIMDSRAFVGCYLHMLTTGIITAEKQFDKIQLEHLAQMGFYIVEHFQFSVNQKVLLQHENLQNFVRILRECKAILMCASQVQPDRILKRFKILRTILRKFHNSLAAAESKPAANEPHPHREETDICTEASYTPIQSLMASPSRSILYETQQSLRTNMFKRQTVVESIKLQHTIGSQTASLEISEILDQLTCLTSNFSGSLSGRK